MSYLGDIHLGDTIDTSFCTVQSTGAPTTLSGSPVLSCYVGNSTTEITAGITLTVDFDSRTGYNHVRIVASSGNGYASGTNVRVVITTGTVNSVSAVGYVVAEFSIDCRGVNQILGTAVSAPATAGILDVNVKNMNNVAATAITTIKAVQGLSTADVITSVTGAVGSVAGAVGSVTAPVTVTGDLSATMKASVTTAASAATPVVTVSDKTGFALTAAYDAAKTAAQASDIPSAATNAAAVQTSAATTPLPANIKKVNSVTVNGDGAGTPWGP